MLQEVHDEYYRASMEDRRILAIQIDFKNNMIASLKQQIEQVKKTVECCQQIINRAINIDFRRCEAGYYAIELRFNGDFMGGISRYGELLEHVAERVAREIQHQIASSKFIETARQNERRQYMANVRRAYQGGEWIDGE
jgi:hypothetical protein